MDSFKDLSGYRNLRLFCRSVALAIVLLVALIERVEAETCLAPARPFVPNDPNAAQQYSELIRQDFEFYIQDIQAYFRCLDEERARAFDEAQEVSREYGRFVQAADE